jgi:protein O-mannosyl-transferase
MKKILLLIAGIILLTFITNGQNPTPRILGVVMGISKYQNVPSLKYADRDAMSFYNFLLSPAGGGADTNNIRLLLNEKATSYNFFEAMDNLLDMAKEGDQVYIYFAGHGDVEKKTGRQNGFLIGFNAPANCYAAGGCIGVRYLQDYVETLVTNNKSKVTMIIDACRSGKLAGGAEGAEVTALALKAEWNGVTKILSCQPGETSLEGEQWGGGAGVFTYFMLKGMLGQADDNGDGKVSVMELNNFLDKNVLNETNNKQLPEIVGDRRQEITKVDKNHALAILNQMERPISLPPEKQSAGFEADISSINDISVLKEYEKFKYYINNNNLIAYNEEDKYKENALSIYRSIENVRAAQPVISKMKGELLAALQNKSQIVMNGWINGNNPDSTFSYAYKELKIAYSMVDSTSPQYTQLKYRYLFWNSIEVKDTLEKIRLLEECIKINPDEPFAYLNLGTFYDGMKNYDEAIFNYDKTIELSKNWVWAWINKGGVLCERGNYNESLKFIDKAIELEPDFEDAWYYKASVLNKLGKNEEGMKCIDKAIELKPEMYKAWILRGNIFSNIRKYDDALKCYDKAIFIKPDYDISWLNKGIAFNNLGKYDDALKCYDKAIFIKPDYDISWLNKGIAFNNLGKYDDALKCWDKVIEINPGSIEALVSKGKTLNYLGKPEDAIKLLDKAIELNPNSNLILRNKGELFNEMGKSEEALQLINKALELDPSDDLSWLDKGNFLYSSGKPEEALKCFDKAIELDSNSSNSRMNKGAILYNLGKYEEALKYIDKSIELDSNNDKAWLNKGGINSSLKRHEEALKYIEKAIKINPQNGQAWLQKGIGLHIYQKKYEEAIICYKKALELNPNEVLANFNLSCAYSMMKNKPEMLKYLKKTIELNPVKYKVDAPKDEDFKEYWNDPEFMELVK